MKKKTILVVEDDKEFARSLSRHLSSGWTIVCCADLQSAQTTVLNQEPPDVVLVDVRLSDSDNANRDGLQFLMFLRDHEMRVPAVVMTAYGEDQFILDGSRRMKLDASALGALRVLYKPFSLEELDDALDDALAAGLLEKKGSKVGFFRKWAPPVGVVVVFLLAWQGACVLFDIKEYLVPTPARVFETMWEGAGSLAIDTGITMLEAGGGFILANVISILVAIGFASSKWFERSFYPYTIALKSVPVVAVAPLLVLWFGYGIWSKIVMAAVVSFFPLVVNATVGLKSVDPDALDLMRSLSATPKEILLKLRFPNAVPYIFSALRISSTLAVVGAVVGELSGAKRGIGFVILVSSYNIDTPMLFAAILAASAAGIAFFGVVALVESRVVMRYSQTNKEEGLQ